MGRWDAAPAWHMHVSQIGRWLIKVDGISRILSSNKETFCDFLLIPHDWAFYYIKVSRFMLFSGRERNFIYLLL